MATLLAPEAGTMEAEAEGEGLTVALMVPAGAEVDGAAGTAGVVLLT
jgi:hypothetical protein